MISGTGLMALSLATLTNEASIEAMGVDIGAALTEQGVAARTVLFSSAAPNPQLILGLIAAMRDSGVPGFVVACNGTSELIIEEQGDGPPLTVNDAWNLPLIAHMVDHPAHHAGQLFRLAEKALVTVIDEGHLRFLNEMGIRARASMFCPHGGPRPLPVQRDTRDRPIDLLFIGNLNTQPAFADWLVATCGTAELLHAVMTEAHDAVIAEQTEVYTVIPRLCPAWDHRAAHADRQAGGGP